MVNRPEKFYVLVWNIKERKPEFRIRFKKKVLDVVIRPRIVIFSLQNRLSIFDRKTLKNLKKIPINPDNGMLITYYY